MFIRRLTLMVATCAGLCSPLVMAQTWPDKQIRIIVAYPAGGGVDLVARVVAQRLGEVLKQQVVVENRGGASGSIGADIVAKAPADGYTLLMASPGEVIVGPAAGQKTPYNAETDFAPVALVGETPLVFVAHPSQPFTSLKDLVAYTKANPGKLSYGSPGNGSSMHFAGESLKAGTGAFMVHKRAFQDPALFKFDMLMVRQHSARCHLGQNSLKSRVWVFHQDLDPYSFEFGFLPRYVFHVDITGRQCSQCLVLLF